MSLKKEKIISVFAIFLISAFVHFGYEFLPNFVTSLFFPVNESIFEHQKMILTSFLIWGIIEYFILKKVQHNNLPMSILISSLVCIIFVILIFSPVYLIILEKNDNTFITLLIYFIGIVVSQLISFKILNSKTNYKQLNYLSIFLYIALMIYFAYLTYNPIKNDLFYDFNKNRYSI